jgi:hypothetical protein
MPTRGLAVIALTLAVTASASAGSRHRPPAGGYLPIDRRGFLFGFSVGAGVIGPDPCADCGVAAAAEIHAGAIASWNGDVALMLEAGGLARSDVHHAFVVAAAQWWPDPFERLWLRAGVGIGSHASDAITEEHRHAVYPTALAAVGVEAVRYERFAIDLQLQGAATREPNRWGRSLSLNVGFNWY